MMPHAQPMSASPDEHLAATFACLERVASHLAKIEHGAREIPREPEMDHGASADRKHEAPR